MVLRAIKYFNLSELSTFLPSLIFFVMGIVTIILDLRQSRREQRSGKQGVWYQRIMTLVGILLLLIGLLVLPTHSTTLAIPPQILSVFFLVVPLIFLMLGIYTAFLLIRLPFKLSIRRQELYVGRTTTQHTSIIANPLLAATRVFLIVVLFLLAIISLPVISQVSSLIISRQIPFWGWLLLSSLLLLVVLLLRTVLRWRTLQRIERLRFLLAHNDVDRLPMWSTPASPTDFTPLSISLRIKRTHLVVFALLLCGFMTPETVDLFIHTSPKGASFDLTAISSPLLLIVFALIVLASGLFPLFVVRTTIAATENGLRNELGRFLHWQEARLFACYKLPAMVPGQSVLVYELSSSNRVITWRWIEHPKSPGTLWRPVLAADLYQQQIQALCEMIVKKTGLPLYDLTQMLEGHSKGRDVQCFE